jgi:hypothetical protein
VWETGKCEEDWLSNRLKLKILDSWRGIIMIESSSTFLSAIIANRMKEQMLEPKGLKRKNGFMLQRGCCDGIFTGQYGTSETA